MADVTLTVDGKEVTVPQGEFGGSAQGMASGPGWRSWTADGLSWRLVLTHFLKGPL
jgi:hypothetical protein